MNDVRGVFSNASGMKSMHSTPQLQSIDKSSVWKLNRCPVPLNLHQELLILYCLSILMMSCDATDQAVAACLQIEVSGDNQRQSY